MFHGSTNRANDPKRDKPRKTKKKWKKTAPVSNLPDLRDVPVVGVLKNPELNVDLLREKHARVAVPVVGVGSQGEVAQQEEADEAAPHQELPNDDGNSNGNNNNNNNNNKGHDHEVDDRPGGGLASAKGRR